MKAHLRWVATFFVVLTFSLSLLAQDTGQLTGTVHDPSGAAIANAQVVVSNASKGINRPTVTNSTGDWLVGGLPSGSYDLTISTPGFKKYQAKGIVLRVGQKLRADANLEVGSANTEITVQGTNVAQVETQSSDLAGTVTGKQITQLQLNGRNFTQLATLVPGVSNQTGQDEGQVGVYGSVAMSFNGGRTEYNNWELDGGDNMDNGSNGTLNVYPSVDAIAEVRVLTSNYGAQYGRNGSGTVETEIKSGTSAFHGNVYEFVRNDDFNARNYFESTVPAYKKNDYGYTLGGPIYIPHVYNTDKQKSFFFWSQEWRKEIVPGQVFNALVPSNLERGGNFSDLCPNPTTGSNADCPHIPGTNTPFPNNTVPINQNGQALLALIPAPNAGVPGGELFNASPTQPTNWREELLRVDHNFNSKMRASFHYIHDSWNTVTPVPLWTNGTSFPTITTQFIGPGVSLVAKLTANASPTLLNEFVFSYTADHIFLTNQGAWQLPSGMNMGSLFPNGFGGRIPGINVINNAAYGGSSGFAQDPGYIPQGLYNSNPTYTFRDNVTKIIGRHNLQFGGYFVAAQKNELGAETSSINSVNGLLTFSASNTRVSTGNAFADLLMGNISSYSQENRQTKYYNRYKILESYLQDDWHVSDHLTLNLGLRLSFFGTYRERYQNAYNFDPAAWSLANAPQIDPNTGALIPGTGNPFNGIVRCGTNGVPAGCMNGKLFNPAPRIGFAYDPRGNAKTAIRGGYGIFFDHTNGNEANTESLENSPPGVLSPTQNNIPSIVNPATGALITSGYNRIGGTGLQFPLSVNSIPTQALWPNMQQWHLDVQHEVASHTVATVSYVGSKGTHLIRQLDINQLQPLPLSLNPYKPGEAIDPSGATVNATGLPPDCGTAFLPNGVPTNAITPSGVPITGQAAVNLAVAACGANPDLFRPFRGYGDVTRLEPMASSVYHAFQASLRHTVGSLQLNAAYTYSHSIDDSSDRGDGSFVNSFNPSSNRASSNFDQRHLLNVGWVYDLPFFKSAGLANKVLGGWQWSGITSWQTGTPFSVTFGNFGDNAGVANGVGTGSRADVVGDPFANIPSNTTPGLGPFVANPSAFVAPRGLTFGDSGRNLLRNPSWYNFDMALYKHFAIKESMAFEFRAEAFNIFNHTEWGPIAGDTGSAAANGSNSGTNSFPSSNFLQVLVAHNPRILQLGLKFIF